MEEVKNSSNRMSPKFGMYILVTAVIFSLLGYLIGSNQKGGAKTLTNLGPISNTKVGQNSVIQNQQATAVGMITQADSSSLTIKASGGETQTFKLSPQFVVYLPSASSSAKVKTSTNASDIQVNKQAIVILQMVNSEYVVTSLSYVQPK